MSGLIKTITLRANYEGNMKGLKDDVAKLKSVRRQLEKTPIKVPIRLDLSGLKSEAAKAADEIRKTVASSTSKLKPGEGMSKGGLVLPANIDRNLKDITKSATQAGNALKTVTRFSGAPGTSQPVSTVTTRQAGRGFKIIERENAKGKKTGEIVDTSDVDRLKDSLAAIDNEFAKKIGGAKGSQTQVSKTLREKRNRISRELEQFPDLEGSPELERARKSLSSLDQQIAQAEGTEGRRAKTDFRKRFSERATGIRGRVEKSLGDKLKANKSDEAIARSIRDRGVREKETNHILDQRSKILARHEQFFRSLAARAERLGQTTSKTKFLNAADSIRGQGKQLDLDRTRESARGSTKTREASLKRRLRLIKARDALERENLALQERHAKKITSRTARERELNRILAQRQAINQRTAAKTAAVGQSARRSGFGGISEQAAKQHGAMTKRMVADQKTLATATRGSGHALNFHTSSLVRNAVTFTKWFVPAQIMMGSFRVINQGIRDAVQAQKEFRILRAVFQGTAKDAEMLADQALALAAANGRSAEEATAATVAWSRLGFTRAQVLIATETSLRAANVAEIDAGKATEYLTGTYKGFELAIADIPEILDVLNALSNKNKVTVTDLFEAYAKAGEVVKQAGTNWQEFGAIVTAVSDNSKVSGKEIGNAVKFVAQRLRRPKQIDKLEKEFGVTLTTETGDIKRLPDIFQELADLFPTLNRGQKAQLLEMSAGARQANRFSLILDNLTEAHIAQARAAMDTNSAARENEAIMTSLGATIEKLETSWVRFLHQLGEAGAFDAARDQLEALMERSAAVAKVIDNLNTSGPGRDQTTIEVESARRRRMLQLIGNNENTGGFWQAAFPTIRNLTGTFNKRSSPDQVRQSIDNAEALRDIGRIIGDEKTLASLKKSRTFNPGILSGRIDAVVDPRRAKSDEQKRFVELVNDLRAGGFGEVDLVSSLKSLARSGGKLDFEGIGVSEDFGDTEGLVQAMDTFIADFRALLEDDQFGKNLDSVTQRARGIVQQETRLRGLDASRTAFRSIAGRLRDRNPDEAKVTRLFDEAIPTLAALPGGAREAAETRIRIRPLIRDGDFKTAAAEIDKVVTKFTEEFEARESDFLQDRERAVTDFGAAIDETSNKITELNIELADTGDPGRQKELTAQIEQANVKLEEQQELFRSLNRDQPELNEDPLAGAAGTNLRKRIEDLKLAGKVAGEVFGSLGTGDPAVDAKIKFGALRQEGDFLASFAARNRQRNAPEIAALESRIPFLKSNLRDLERGGGDREALAAARERLRTDEQRLALLSEGQTLIDQEVKDARKATREAEKQLDLERKLIGVRESFEAASGTARRRGAVFATGRDETAQLLNQTRANLDLLPGDLASARATDDPVKRAAALGSLSERLRASKEGVENVESRLFNLTAGRVNLEFEIAKAQREQREEASKRLSLASREDQLRAAAAKAFEEENGQISREQFSFFSGNTRGAINNLTPGSVAGLDDNARANNKRRRELDDEIKRLAEALDPLRQTFISLRENLRNRAPGIPAPGNFLEGDKPGGRGDETFTANPKEILLNTGPINIRIDMAEQVSRLRDLLRGDMNAKLDSALTRLRSDFLDRQPNTAPANGVE